MIMSVQHNSMSMNAFYKLNINRSALSKNLEKLSSGYRINRAGDDAAGLAVSEKMRAQIMGLNAAEKNAKDGISLVQTAEGAMQEMHEMLNRMVQLAEQAANGTLNDATDRAALEKELLSLKTEIDRIAFGTNFNGINLLDGSLSANTSPISVKSSPLSVHDNLTVTLLDDYEKNLLTDDVFQPNKMEQGGDHSTKLTEQVLLNQLTEKIIPQAVDNLLKMFPYTFGDLKGVTIGIGDGVLKTSLHLDIRGKNRVEQILLDNGYSFDGTVSSIAHRQLDEIILHSNTRQELLDELLPWLDKHFELVEVQDDGTIAVRKGHTGTPVDILNTTALNPSPRSVYS